MTIFKDISGKVDSTTLELIADLDRVLRSSDVTYMLIGAMARDLVFTTLLDIHTSRTTIDIDFVVQIASWNDYNEISSGLVESGKFQKESKQKQRFLHISGTIVDIVPCGEIENPTGAIAWPPDGGIVMSTLGMRDALANAIALRLSSQPPFDIKVCSPAGLAVMKIVAWSERTSQGTGKDAVDLFFLMNNYLHAHEIHPQQDQDDIWSEDLPFEQASARLLGRHIAVIASAQTRSKLEEVLIAEVAEDSSLQLATDMVREQLLFAGDDVREKARLSIRQLLLGIQGT